MIAAKDAVNRIRFDLLVVAQLALERFLVRPSPCAGLCCSSWWWSQA
jgi:hypothetical protein